MKINLVISDLRHLRECIEADDVQALACTLESRHLDVAILNSFVTLAAGLNKPHTLAFLLNREELDPSVAHPRHRRLADVMSRISAFRGLCDTKGEEKPCSESPLPQSGFCERVAALALERGTTCLICQSFNCQSTGVRGMGRPDRSCACCRFAGQTPCLAALQGQSGAALSVLLDLPGIRLAPFTECILEKDFGSFGDLMMVGPPTGRAALDAGMDVKDLESARPQAFSGQSFVCSTSNEMLERYILTTRRRLAQVVDASIQANARYQHVPKELIDIVTEFTCSVVTKKRKVGAQDR